MKTLLFLVWLWVFGSPFAALRAAEDTRPDIVVIVVDDMRFDEFGRGGHSFLETPHIDALARAGVNFSRAYHATPLCSPNRASLLTGQYASRHGILDNTSRSHASHELDLFAKTLQESGYATAHIGKWHMGNNPSPLPGYDYWVSFAGHGKIVDPELYDDGRIHTVKGYVTDIFTERALQFIEDGSDTGKPFFLYIGHKAIHPEARQRDDGSADTSVTREFIPAERHKDRYRDEIFPPPPNRMHELPAGSTKTALRDALTKRRRLADKDDYWRDWIASGFTQETIRKRAEMMLAVDEGLGRIVESLKNRDRWHNTLVIFTSDNGYFFGEHGLTIERRFPYEESIRAPLIVKAPTGKGAAAKASDALVSSVDLAPTILDYAKVAIPSAVQGRSLRPLLEGKAGAVRDIVYVEYYSHENPFTWTSRCDYRVVIGGHHKLIRWLRYEGAAAEELYDLANDPHELRNLSGAGGKARTLNRTLNHLRQEMERESLNALGFKSQPRQ